MAHASTDWRSNLWHMNVDTRSMGYSYNLEDIAGIDSVKGCDISGRWYEPLTDTELLSATQEIRDLVRYTPVSVELNGRAISRDPRSEKWDHEDEFAWYRVKVEGAVSIYNQGVLVRHDSSHQWGAGGLIVSKRAISLNVSRTEILRKTCPVWQPIAKQFGTMAREISAQLGAHRKSEASREKAAHDLLAGTENLLQTFESGEVITLLPGKRHLSLYGFLELNRRLHGGRVSVAENAFDIPKAEAIAREKIAQIIHPITLARFNCPTTEDFCDALERIMLIARERWMALTQTERYRFRIWNLDGMNLPEFIDFATLREEFVERTTMVREKDALDRETRRMWTALRWCLQQYAGLCAGGRKTRNRGSHYLSGDEFRKHILLGESNTMEAWTDGESYLAFNANIVRRLRQDPIKTAGYLFSLTEHEVAHQGDSVDCGHDEAFYQRYHDISIGMAAERQRYMHLFIQKYVYSMEGEGNRDRSKVWYEQRLVERANNGRQKRELSPVIEDMTTLPFLADPVVSEESDLIVTINARLVESGALPPPPDWDEVRRQARAAQKRRAEAWRAEVLEREECARQSDEHDREEMARIAKILDVAVDDIHPVAWSDLFYLEADQLQFVWEDKPWERELLAELDSDLYDDEHFPTPEELKEEMQAIRREEDDASLRLSSEYHQMLEPGETWWSLERNAAAAGFHRVEDYLSWRAEACEKSEKARATESAK